MSNYNVSNVKRRMRKRLLIFTAVFLSAMAILTFFSKTLYYQLTPKVIAGRPTGGRLSRSFVVEIEKHYVSAELVIFPMQLNGTLLISEVLIQPNQQIAAGTPVLAFDRNTYASVRGQYADAIATLENELILFDLSQRTENVGLEEDLDYIYAKQDLEESLAEVNAALREEMPDNKTVQALQREVGKLQEAHTELDTLLAQQNLLYAEGMVTRASITEIAKSIQNNEDAIRDKEWQITEAITDASKALIDQRDSIEKELEKLNRNHTRNLERAQTQAQAGNAASNAFSRSLIVQKIEKAKHDLDRFDTLLNYEAQWAIDRACTVSSIDIAPGASLSGFQPILHIVAPDAPLTYRAIINEVQARDINIMDSCSAIVYGEKIGFVVHRKYAENGQYYIDLLPAAELSSNVERVFNMGGGIRADITINSRYYDLLLPNRAVVRGQFVYIVQNRTSFFGEEQYIERIEVTVQDADDIYTAVNGYIPNDALVVTGWDGTLTDGQTVVLLE